MFETWFDDSINFLVRLESHPQLCSSEDFLVVQDLIDIFVRTWLIWLWRRWILTKTAASATRTLRQRWFPIFRQQGEKVILGFEVLGESLFYLNSFNLIFELLTWWSKSRSSTSLCSWRRLVPAFLVLKPSINFSSRFTSILFHLIKFVRWSLSVISMQVMDKPEGIKSIQNFFLGLT